MMRYTLILSAVLIGLAQTAGAIACSYSGEGIAAEALPAARCWDLAAWPEADAKAFCKNIPMTAERIGSQQVTQCPAGAVGKCVKAVHRVQMDESVVPEEDYAKMPPALAAQVRTYLSQMNAELAELKRYDGNVMNLYYYPDPSGFIQLAGQQQDCENRGGRWMQ